MTWERVIPLFPSHNGPQVQQDHQSFTNLRPTLLISEVGSFANDDRTSPPSGLPSTGQDMSHKNIAPFYVGWGLQNSLGESIWELRDCQEGDQPFPSSQKLFTQRPTKSMVCVTTMLGYKGKVKAKNPEYPEAVNMLCARMHGFQVWGREVPSQSLAC